MKKLLYSFFLLVLMGGMASAQSLQTLDQNLSINKEFNKTEIPAASKAAVHDTVYFCLARLSSVDSAKYIGVYASSANSVGQFFECPQQITITGVNFYGLSYPAPSVTATVAIYAANADSLATGAALATATVAVDSAFNNGVEINVNFPTALVINVPYVVTISNATANPLYIVSTNYKTNDGLGQNLASARIGTTWYHAYDLTVGGFNYDADFLIHPIVDYTLANASFTKNPTCLNGANTNVAFDLTAPTMYTSWMYNYWAWAGTPENGFLWDYGDGGSTPYALDNNHIYATAAYYSINMYYYYEAWTSFTAIDSVEDFIDVCVGVNENNAEKILLSPNPNNGSFTLENALGYRIEIYNMLGMPVFSTEVTETRLALDLGAYARGAYEIRFSSNNSQFSKTILVE